MLYLTCTMISSVDLAHYQLSRADRVSMDCGTKTYSPSSICRKPCLHNRTLIFQQIILERCILLNIPGPNMVCTPCWSSRQVRK